MRRQREGMVQTQQQYRFCYEAIAKALLPAEMDKELDSFPDSRPTSYPPPPYREKEEDSLVPKPPHGRDSSPPPPPTSPPPPLSDPSTPVKAPITYTPPGATPPTAETPPSATPSTTSPTDSMEKRRLSQASSAMTPSRPVSSEGGEHTRRKIAGSAKREIAVEVESKTRVEPKVIEPKKVQPQRVEPKKFQSHKVEPKKVQPQKVEPKKFQPQKVEPKKVQPQKVESKETVMSTILPSVIVTYPSSEGLNKITLMEDEVPPSPPSSPPPSSEDEAPPPLPSSPPPAMSPSTGEDITLPEPDEEGFAIGDDQVMIETPFKRKKSLPRNTPKWKYQAGSNAPATSEVPKWKFQRRAEEASRRLEGREHPPSPGKVEWRPQQRQQEENKQVTPGKVPIPTYKESAQENSPRKVGKITIPQAFQGSGSSPERKPFPSAVSSHIRKSQNVEPSRVDIAKFSGSHPTPPSSPVPAGRKKWSPKVTGTPSPEKEEQKEVPPALKKLKQLQHKGMQSSLSSSPIYKLPSMSPSPTKSEHSTPSTPSHSDTNAAKPDGSHSADTGSGNVLRLLAKFQ